WVNPVAMMYDELYDAALRQEVEALKGRIANVEATVNDLKKDSDGDGVSDQFDKCPGTPTGAVVDGSGCPFGFVADTLQALPAAATYSNIQFEFDSSVLRTSAYPTLDATAADLRSSGATIEIDGFASKDEGTAAHKMSLSKDRANSVKIYLVNSGVDAKKIKIKAFGETHPIADNSTEEGRVLNRRVQFVKQAGISSPFPFRVIFDAHQSVLKPAMQNKLKEIAAYLTANPGTQIDLKGHCNTQEIPRLELNNDSNAPIKLSQARVNSVFNYLISQHVTAGQIKSKTALGTASPLSGINSYDRQFQNRSVEISKR
ncbi:MAG: OmpA family protein, partial [Mucilaginibacter sp.]|nr:OmpA family protein [Mucilaginibacter sp.]